MNQEPPSTATQQTASLEWHRLFARCKTLGTTCLVLAILEFLYCANRLASPFISGAIFKLQRSMMSHAPASNPVMEVAQIFAKRIAVWESLRTIPFLLATVFLFWIALRLRKGDVDALRAAQTWMFGAFAAIVASVLLQVLVTVPATLEYQRQVAALMLTPPAGKSLPIDMQGMMSAMTMVATVVGVIMGTLALSVWPVVLRVWAGRLLRAAPQQGLLSE